MRYIETKLDEIFFDHLDELETIKIYDRTFQTEIGEVDFEIWTPIELVSDNRIFLINIMDESDQLEKFMSTDIVESIQQIEKLVLQFVEAQIQERKKTDA